MSQVPGCQGCRAASQGNKKETSLSATELLHNTSLTLLILSLYDKINLNETFYMNFQYFQNLIFAVQSISDDPSLTPVALAVDISLMTSDH